MNASVQTISTTIDHIAASAIGIRRIVVPLPEKAAIMARALDASTESAEAFCTMKEALPQYNIITVHHSLSVGHLHPRR